VSATFSEAIAPASVTGTSFVLRDAGGNAVPCHRHGQRRDRDPAAQLATHLLDHLHRHSALRLERNQRHGRRRPRLGLHWSFTTGPGRPPLLALDPTTTPQTPAVDDNNSLELGGRFPWTWRATSGIRFYKGAGNTGTHVGHRWTTDEYQESGGGALPEFAVI
jgi:hypothetical protein